MCDMAHISGLVATGLLNNPFDYCDIVSTTTHKTLRGPSGAMIFCKKELCDLLIFQYFQCYKVVLINIQFQVLLHNY